MVWMPRPSYVRQFISAKINGRKTPLSLEEIKAILAHYDLGHWQVYRALGGGNTSNNVLLQTSRGKKVLKKYYRGLSPVMQEHFILRHLTDTDFPFARLVVNKEGLTCTELENKYYAIYDFIDGYRSIDYFMSARTKEQLVAQAGETLAWLHQLMVGIVPESWQLYRFMPNGERLRRDVTWHLNILEQYVANIVQTQSLDDQDTFLSSFADEIKRDLMEVGRYYEQADLGLPKQVIHSDYIPNNVVFNKGKLVGVLDFGDVHVNMRVKDVGRGLIGFSCPDRGFGINKRLARIFLSAYEARQPLSDKEIEAIPDLARWRFLTGITWTMNLYLNQETADDHLVSIFREKWRKAHWMKIHSDELRTFLLSNR